MKDKMFKYPDTNSSRANIEILNQKFNEQKVAIIGLGGTGSYILDLIAKTPVREIHIFDNDDFLLHNAFRAPGAISIEEMESCTELKKVDYFQRIYSNMHTGIVKHAHLVEPKDIDNFIHFSIVFICVDKNSVRAALAQRLSALNIPFIDTGLGIKKVNDSLIGTIRVTTATPSKRDHLKDRFGEDEFEENEYTTNIQIADLNSLNAVLAVIKWKKMCHFYQDIKQENNSLYFINTNKLLNEDHTSSIC